MSLYQQIPQIDDPHARCRASVFRFVVLDYTIKSLAESADEEQIRINLENPYSMDIIDQDVISIALDAFRI